MSVNEQHQSEVAEYEDHFYIKAQSSLADDRTRVLLHRETFAVFDQYGDIRPLGLAPQGLFHQETRYLSRLELRIGGLRPLLLSSTIRDDNVLFGIDLMNPDMTLQNGEHLLSGTLHIYRTKFISDGACYERVAVHNYGQKTVEVGLSFTFGADYADIFEVRGQQRARRGTYFPEEFGTSSITLGYEGLDQVFRRTRIQCSEPCVTGDSRIYVPIQCKPQNDVAFEINIVCQNGSPGSNLTNYTDGLSRITSERRMSPVADLDIHSSNERFNDLVKRSRADLEMMISETPFGPYPYAGVPWFSTVFGRDGIITALELLWLAPAVARGVLSYLAATQSTTSDDTSDAEPGKILHEMRKGEMAQLGEVPFGCYYGSVDSTPLFVLLAGAYYERTGDLEFVRSIWTHIQAALDWMKNYGDVDGDGFIEYSRKTEHGLLQQGWKDSQDSVFHCDGKIAEGPIALCEVQAYAFAAKTLISAAADDLGFNEMAAHLRSEAEEMRRRFEEVFWSDEISMFALALDGEKRRCNVPTSNAGQCLFSGIASAAHRQRIVDTLMSPRFFSGWGVRTVATGESRYNPMSYHNGSLWPHDNALIAYGLAESREKHLALAILSGMLDLSVFMPINRLPELICGFPRRPGKGPTQYPVACAPQAWAAGSVFLILQACLGLTVRAKESRIYLHHPALPPALDRLRIRNIKVGQSMVDLEFERHAETVGMEIVRRTGDVEIVSLR